MAMAVMREIGFHLHPPPPSPSRRTFLHLHNLNPNFHFHCSPISTYGLRFLLLSPLPLHIRQCSRWDSNAEPYRTKNLNFDPNDENDDSIDSTEQWEVLDDFIDSIWILKVFGSYGWMLPPLLFSLLLVNGPKAFLMALAVPLGQSTFAFAIQRFQERDKIKPKGPKRKNKTKKGRSRPYSSRDIELEEAPEFYVSQEIRTQKKGYQSWVSNDRSTNNFGGWDELDSERDSNVGSSRRAAQRSSRIPGTPPRKGKKKKLSARDGPLLLRLLISIFPFLSSWTKVL